MQPIPDHLMPIPKTRCQHLTCKGMAVFGEDYLTPKDEHNRSHPLICSKTQTVMGPDEKLVLFANCTPSRACYEEL